MKSSHHIIRLTLLAIGALVVASCGSSTADTTVAAAAPSSSSSSTSTSSSTTSTTTTTLAATTTSTSTTTTTTTVPPTTTTTTTTVPPTTTTTKPPQTVVNMDTGSFLPASKTIAAGTKVLWHNTDETEAHDVKAGTRLSPTGLFGSGNLLPDDWFSYTFTEVGTVDYFCSIHFGMDGTITVTP